MLRFVKPPHLKGWQHRRADQGPDSALAPVVEALEPGHHQQLEAVGFVPDWPQGRRFVVGRLLSRREGFKVSR